MGAPHRAGGGLLARDEAEARARGGVDPRPRLLLLDEPLTGLDAAAARQVKDALRAFVGGGGAVVLTTHILEVAERLADRIGIIARGRLVAEGTPAELLARTGTASLEDAFLLLTGPDVPAAGVPLEAR